MIHKFLSDYLGAERATFKGAFDIPLWLIAYGDNGELWSRFMKQERYLPKSEYLEED